MPLCPAEPAPRNTRARSVRAPPPGRRAGRIPRATRRSPPSKLKPAFEILDQRAVFDRGDIRSAVLCRRLLPPSAGRSHGGRVAGRDPRRAGGGERGRSVGVDRGRPAGARCASREGARTAAAGPARRLARGHARSDELANLKPALAGAARTRGSSAASAARSSSHRSRSTPSEPRAHRGADAGDRRDRRIAGRIRRAPLARRHGQRQDRGVSAGHCRGLGRRRPGAGARARDRADPATRRALRAPLQRGRRRDAFSAQHGACAATPGAPPTAVRRESSSEPARRCSPRSTSSASSWSMRSTMPRTSNRKGSATPHAIWRSGGRSAPGYPSCWDRPLPRSKRWRTWRRGATRGCPCRSARAPRKRRA